jgi:hypothetical protein
VEQWVSWPETEKTASKEDKAQTCEVVEQLQKELVAKVFPHSFFIPKSVCVCVRVHKYKCVWFLRLYFSKRSKFSIIPFPVNRLVNGDAMVVIQVWVLEIILQQF